MATTKKEQYDVSAVHGDQRKRLEEYLYKSELLAYFLFFVRYFLNTFPGSAVPDTQNQLYVLIAATLFLVRDNLLEEAVISKERGRWLNRNIFWIERMFMCRFFYGFLDGQNDIDMKEAALTAAMAGLFVGFNLAYFLSFWVSLVKPPAVENALVKALIDDTDTDTDCECSSSSTHQSETETKRSTQESETETKRQQITEDVSFGWSRQPRVNFLPTL